MRANILLVDDEPSVLRYTKTLLEIDWYRFKALVRELKEDTEAKEIQRALDNTAQRLLNSTLATRPCFARPNNTV